MFRILAASLFALVLAGGASAQTAVPDDDNAAILYLRASKDLPVLIGDQETKFYKVAGGEMPWDEAVLGPVVDGAKKQLADLIEGTGRPRCAFGLDMSEGMTLSLAHLPPIRFLARLNACDAARRLAGGRPAEALALWLAGVRLAVHLGSEGPLIQGLVAIAIFNISTEALRRAIGDGALDEAACATVEKEFRALPTYCLDWPAVLTDERETAKGTLDRLVAMDDPAGFIDSMETLGEKLPKELEGKINELRKADAKDKGTRAREFIRGISGGWRDDTLKTMDEIVSFWSLPWSESSPKILAIEKALSKMSPFARLLLPSFGGADHSRARMELARAAMIAFCVLRRSRDGSGKLRVSLEGLDVPPDPFTGKPIAVSRTEVGIELSSPGPIPEEPRIVYRMKEK